MSYLLEIPQLSQTQALENLKAVVQSPFFRDYEVESGESIINSDVINVQYLGGYKKGSVERYTVGDLADMIVSILDGVSKGLVHDASVSVSQSQSALRAMNFEQALYEDEFSLPLRFGIRREGGRDDSDPHLFYASQWGFKESYFEAQRLNLRDANRKLNVWYKAISKELKKILPHQK